MLSIIINSPLYWRREFGIVFNDYNIWFYYIYFFPYIIIITIDINTEQSNIAYEMATNQLIYIIPPDKLVLK
ncbi:hypothetical protein MC65_001415 [Aeromonas caviae]|nr:hypothetical protein MC65_001415 [Aeromonas caviae]